MKLKDIIDLDYLAGKDEALTSEADIRQREDRDKKIFEGIRNFCRTDREILLSWLDARRQEFHGEKSRTGLSLLPGTVFSSLYSFMVYAMVFLGSISGLSLSWSFLAYHGTRPVNVALFISLFIGLQVVLILMTVFFLILRSMKIRSKKGGFQNTVIHTLVSSLFFHVLPGLLKKKESRILKKGRDTLEYSTTLIRMKTREYQELFFWPFFILIAVFAFCFTTSTLAGTFFRIIVSDMAFGWQSTLMTSSRTIHDLITGMALPWSWFMPEHLAHPTLAQIEGSRIILKDGISVLATRDLVSWWPFLCLGILFYAVIPRGILMAAGIFAQRRALHLFNLDRAVFRPLMIRMQSSVLDIDPVPLTVKMAGHGTNHDRITGSAGCLVHKDFSPASQNSRTRAQKAVVLAPGAVYPEQALKKILDHIRTRLFFEIKEIIQISLDPETDAAILDRIKNSDADQVVLVHEAWQPPIRGLLYYFKQLRSVMPEKMLLWILLTRDAGREDLGLDEGDVNVEIWRKSVFKLGDPGIKIVRFG